MAYYDSFTKKPQSKRDDWRDDELTRRPARDGGRAAEPEHRYGEKKSYGERKPYGERREYGEKKPYGERREYGERKPYGERREYGEKKPYGERREYGEKKPFEDRPQRPYGEKPAFGGPRPERRDSRPERPVRQERPAPAPMTPPTEEPMENNLLVGRNPIREALRAGRDIEKLLVARGELIGSAREIVAMAREAKIVVQEVDRVRLDQMAPNHQGLIAVASAYAYKTVDDMLALAKARGEDPLLVILDGVTDPRNFGACLRVADAAGVQAVVAPRDRSASFSPAAAKAAAGAWETVPVVTVTNLAGAIADLRDAGVMVVGTAGEATKTIYEFEQKRAFAWVLGAEGEGYALFMSAIYSLGEYGAGLGLEGGAVRVSYVAEHSYYLAML